MKTGFERKLDTRLYIRATPGDNLDYTLDYTPELNELETIVTSTWSVPAAVTKGATGHADKTATVWLTGGTVGQKHDIVNTILTSDGREFVRTFWLAVVDHLS